MRVKTPQYQAFFKRLIISVMIISEVIALIPLNILSSHAASTAYLFDNPSNFSEFYGTSISSNNLVLSPDSNNYTEDFNGYSNGQLPTGWSRTSTDWYTDNSTYYYATNAYDDAKTLYTSQSTRNAEFSADLNVLGGEQMAGLMFRVVDNSNYMIFSFSPRYGFAGIHKIVNGVETSIINISETIDVGVSYNYKVFFNGNHIVASINGVEKINIYDSTFTSAGNVGFWRNGSAVKVDNVILTPQTYENGYVVSNPYTESAGISSVSLLNVSGTNTSQLYYLVSNDNGATWNTILVGQKLYFTTTGNQFMFKVYLKKGISNPTLSSITFDVRTGVRDTISFQKNTGVSKLHYTDGANSKVTSSMNPSDISLFRTIPNTKIVQQAAIVYFDNKTVMYYGDSEFHLAVAYDITSNTQLWSRNLNGYIESTPLVLNGKVYFGSYDTKLYALNQSDGTIAWTYTANDALSGGQIDAFNDNIYFTDYGYNGTTSMYSVNMTSHNLNWSFPIPGNAFLTYTIDRETNTIYMVSSDILYALNISDGSIIWSSTLNRGYITKQPVILGDKLAIGSDRGIQVVNKFTGETIWFNNDNFGAAESGLGATVVSDGTNIFYPSKSDHKLYSRNLATGSLNWGVNVADNIGTFSTPVLTEDGFLYISYNSGVRVFNKANGTQVWQSSQPSWNENNVTIGHGYMVFTDPAGAGNVYIYRVIRETIGSLNGINLLRDDREITSIKLNNIQTAQFGCDAVNVDLRGTGTYVVEYGTLAPSTVKPTSMIINNLGGGGIHACNTHGTGISFTYDFGNSNVTDIYKDGTALSKAVWSANGSVITITDSFSDHTYQLSVNGVQLTLTPNKAATSEVVEVSASYTNSLAFSAGDKVNLIWENGTGFGIANTCTNQTIDANGDSVTDGSATIVNGNTYQYTFSDAVPAGNLLFCMKVTAYSSQTSNSVLLLDENNNFGASVFYTEGDNNVFVIANVAPTLSFNIRDINDTADTNVCNFGTVTTSTLIPNYDNIIDAGAGECGYSLAIGTNAVNGFQTQISANHDLSSGSANISNIGNGGVFVGGIESYGFANITSAQTGRNLTTGLPTESISRNGNFDLVGNTGTYIPLLETNLISYNNGIEYIANVNSNDVTKIIHGLVVGAGTPAGYYDQVITYTTTASF